MTQEELAALFIKIASGNKGPQLDGVWPEKDIEEHTKYFMKLNWVDWLREDVSEEYENYYNFVKDRLESEPDKRPFCPFYGDEKVGYCELAHKRCYNCEESKSEFYRKYKKPDFTNHTGNALDYPN